MQRPIKDRYDLLRQNIAKFVFDKKTRQNKSEAFDISGVKSVLFLRNDNKIGDMAVSSCLFREIKLKYPNIKIFVLCGKDNKEIIKHNPYVDEIITLKQSFIANLILFKKLGTQKFSLVADFLPLKPKPAYLLMLRLLNPVFLTGFYKKSYNLYDFSFEENLFNKHITQYYKLFLNFLGIENPSLKYDLFLGAQEDEAKKITEPLVKAGIKIITINPFAASKHRTMSIEKIKELSNLITGSLAANKIKCKFFILAEYGKAKQTDFGENIKPCHSGLDPESILPSCRKTWTPFFNGASLRSDLDTGDNLSLFISKSILESAALIKFSDLIISPDTSIVHIAAAFNKKLVALYLDYSQQTEKTNIIWGPNYANASQICLDRQNGTLSNDVENIPNALIAEKAVKLLSN